MPKGERIGSAIILLLIISAIPHLTHMTLGRICGCGQYNELSQYKNFERNRIYRESGLDRIQSEMPAWKLMTMNSEIKKKRISDKLAYYLQQINNTFGHAKDLIGEAYRIATEEENYTPEEAKKLLLENITIFSKRTIYSSLPNECKDIIQQHRRLNKRKPVANLQRPILHHTEDAEILYKTSSTEGAANIQSPDNDDLIPTEESELGQKQNTVERCRGQIIQFKLPGDMMDEFLSYMGMAGKDDYCIGWIYDGELIDWEISPVLEGRMQATDNPRKTYRRKKRLDLEKTSLDNASHLKRSV